MSTTASPERYRAFSIASFVVGIVSIVAGWTLIAPIVGLVLGIIALRNNTTERTFAVWGVVLNSVMLALFALGMLLLLLLAVLGIFTLPLFL